MAQARSRGGVARRQAGASQSSLAAMATTMPQLSRRTVVCGHVVTDAQQPGYTGAERPTNNTGELTAIAQALEYILADRSGRPVLVRYDSLYAGNMAAGKWRPRKNKVLVSHVRRLWTRAHTHLHGRLWTSHVYGHSNHQWNDRADALASQGRGGAPT